MGVSILMNPGKCNVGAGGYGTEPWTNQVTRCGSGTRRKVDLLEQQGLRRPHMSMAAPTCEHQIFGVASGLLRRESGTEAVAEVAEVLAAECIAMTPGHVMICCTSSFLVRFL